MKKTLLAVLFFVSCSMFAQSNFMLNTISYPTCFGNCDGVAVFSTTTTTGPFTAVLSNTSGCPNSTVQTSTGNTITLSNLCTCASTYSINFYNSSMVLVGYELLQVPISATSALVLQTPTVDPAVCSTCCDASVYVVYSGGYEQPPTNNATVTLDGNNVIGSYNPIDSVCVGQHTVCIKDLANCIVCNTFSVNFVTHVGLKETHLNETFVLSPNPANDKVTIHARTNGKLSHIKLMDMNGKLIMERSDPDPNSPFELYIGELPSGVYSVEIQDSDHFLRQKLIKLD